MNILTILFWIVICILLVIIYGLIKILKTARLEIKLFQYKLTEWKTTLEAQSRKINNIFDKLKIVSADLGEGHDWTSVETYYVDEKSGALIKLVKMDDDKKNEENLAN